MHLRKKKKKKQVGVEINDLPGQPENGMNYMSVINEWKPRRFSRGSYKYVRKIFIRNKYKNSYTMNRAS